MNSDIVFVCLPDDDKVYIFDKKNTTILKQVEVFEELKDALIYSCNKKKLNDHENNVSIYSKPPWIRTYCDGRSHATNIRDDGCKK